MPGRLIKSSLFCQDLPHRTAIFLFIGFLLCNLVPVSGQDQRVADSLKRIYEDEVFEGTELLDLLKELSFNELNNRELSLKYAEELIRLSELENNLNFLFSGLLQKGEYYKKTGDLEKALEIYFKAVNIAVELEDPEDEGIAYVTIADVYAIMENYANSERFYNKAIEILRSSTDSIGLASALLNAGDTYYTMGRYEQIVAMLLQH